MLVCRHRSRVLQHALRGGVEGRRHTRHLRGWPLRLLRLTEHVRGPRSGCTLCTGRPHPTLTRRDASTNCRLETRPAADPAAAPPSTPQRKFGKAPVDSGSARSTSSSCPISRRATAIGVRVGRARGVCTARVKRATSHVDDAGNAVPASLTQLPEARVIRNPLSAVATETAGGRSSPKLLEYRRKR